MDSSKTITISASQLRWLNICKRHIWLNAFGADHLRKEPEPAFLYRVDQGNYHEHAVHRATTDQVRTLPVSGWLEAVATTASLIEQGVRGIIGACIEVKTQLEGISAPIIVRGKIDRLVRVDLGHSVKERIIVERTGRAFVYAPVEIKRYSTLTPADHLQMDLYMWLLSQLQDVESPMAEFWLGADVMSNPNQIIEHSYDEQRILDALLTTAHLMANRQTEPEVRIEPHCKDCPWYMTCTETAKSNTNVTLLSLHRETRLHFAQAGITSLHQIMEMEEKTLLTFRFVGAKSVKKLKAQAEAFLSNRPVVLSKVPKVCREKGWFFDIETDPSTDQVWSIGWCWQDEPTQILIVAPGCNGDVLALPDGRKVILVDSMAAAWSAFAASVAANQQPIFHWTMFDAANMRKHAPSQVVNSLNPRLHDLYSSFKNTIQLPERSNSLKVVAPYAGFRWKGYQDWWAALRDYQLFLASDDPKHLVEACNYQAGDVEAMVAVWNWLNSFERTL